MIQVQNRQRFLLTLAAVAASVFLFACGGSEPPEVADSSGAPARRGPASASLGGPADGRPNPMVVQVPPEKALPRATWGEPASAQPSGPVTFGSPVPDESFRVVGEGEGFEQDEPARPAAPVQPDGTRVFSNKDLRRYAEVKQQFGFSDNSFVVDVSRRNEEKEDPSRPAPLTRAEWVKQHEQVFSEVSRLTKELEYLKGRVPSLHNPLLPRAQLNEADKVSEAGMDNAQRLQKIQQQIAETERSLTDAKRRLGELQSNVPPDEGSRNP